MYLLEDETKFSESLLWSLQKKAYMDFGPKAWSEKGVPFYMTSNSFTARSYARVLARKIKESDSKCFIFDLGSGCGKFAYFFVKSLLDFGIDSTRFSYVLCDMVQENLDFCKEHPRMQALINLGCVDFACFELYASKEIYLQQSGSVFESSSGPLFLIANYFFDTVCQELYKVQDSKLYQGYVKTYSSKVFEDAMDPRLIEHLHFEYSYRLLEQSPKSLLGQSTYQGEFLYPKGAVEVLDFFSQKAQTCLLAGDQGSYDLHFSEISKHASFSFPVSYFFLEQYFLNKSGMSLKTEFPGREFVVFLGADFEDFFLKRSFEESISDFEPRDYWVLINSLEGHHDKLDLDALFMLLKLGNWDYNNFYLFTPRISELLVKAATKEHKRWIQLFSKVWQQFYPVSEKEAVLPLNIAKCLYVLKYYDLAIYYLKECLEICPHSELAEDLLSRAQKEKSSL